MIENNKDKNKPATNDPETNKPKTESTEKPTVEKTVAPVSEPTSDSSTKPTTTTTSENVTKLLEIVDKMSLSEVFATVEALKDKYNITPMQVASKGSDDGDEEKPKAADKVDLILKEVGTQKVKVIGVVRTIVPNLGLMDANKLISQPNAVIKTGLTPAEGEELKKKFAEVNAVAETQESKE